MVVFRCRKVPVVGRRCSGLGPSSTTHVTRTCASPTPRHNSSSGLRLDAELHVGCVQTAFCWEEGSGSAASYGLFFALREIVVGEEVTVSYMSEELLSNGVEERQRHLRAKPGMEWVLCSCARCVAETSG